MSKTTVCNQALLHLKNSKLLTNVDSDNTLISNAFLLFWDDVLEEMLREFEWPFAKETATLALVEDDPDDGVEWGFSYRWPSDCIKARYIVDGNLNPSAQHPRIEFEIGSDDSGKLIFTNEQDAVLAYTRLIDDITLASAKFRAAMSYKLAYKVAPVLCGEDRTGLGQKAQMNYELEFSRAMAEYLNERKRAAPPEAEAIEGR